MALWKEPFLLRHTVMNRSDQLSRPSIETIEVSLQFRTTKVLSVVTQGQQQNTYEASLLTKYLIYKNVLGVRVLWTICCVLLLIKRKWKEINSKQVKVPICEHQCANLKVKCDINTLSQKSTFRPYILVRNQCISVTTSGIFNQPHWINFNPLRMLKHEQPIDPWPLNTTHVY